MPLQASLIRQLLQAQPGTRPSLESIMDHPCWLSDAELLKKCTALSDCLQKLDKARFKFLQSTWLKLAQCCIHHAARTYCMEPADSSLIIIMSAVLCRAMLRCTVLCCSVVCNTVLRNAANNLCMAKSLLRKKIMALMKATSIIFFCCACREKGA